MLKSEKMRQRRIAKYDGPEPVDVMVGERVRTRRRQLGMSQERLGELLGVSFQQIQKYELGRNRVSASRLYQLGKLLEVGISYFFQDAEVSNEIDMPMEDRPTKRDTYEMVDAFRRIPSPKIRRRIVELVKAEAASRAEPS